MYSVGSLSSSLSVRSVCSSSVTLTRVLICWAYLCLAHQARGGDDVSLVVHERADDKDDEAGELQERVLVESLSQPGGREVEEAAVDNPHEQGTL